MKLRYRFLLVGFGVIVFVIITPFIVLYARGFKVNWQNQTFVKTGALVVKSEPTKAEIFINDEKIDQLTPANVRFLLPNDYNIRIEKPDYQSWTKRLSVKSQLVTWANSDREFVALFLTNPILEKSWTGTNIIFNDNTLTFLENTEPTQISTDDGDVKKISALPDTTQATESINQILTDLKIPVPAFKTGQLVRTENRVYMILDNTLYVINGGLEKIYAPVSYAVENGSRLVYSNDNEIYVYYADWQKSDLILRTQSPLKNPIFNPETGYMFFQNEGKIKTVELDSRDHRNLYNLTEALDGFAVSKDGKKVFTYSASEIRQYLVR